MKLVMTLLVRDEIDVVAATIEHHLAAGVDHVVVTDNGSTDGTLELLQRYADTGRVSLYQEPATDYQQDVWVTRMARRAAVDHQADWVINADADEFLWPMSADGFLQFDTEIDLKAALSGVPAEAGSVTVRRDNLRHRPDVTGSWVTTHTLRDTLSRSERGTRIGPKSVHRADPEVDVAFGNHAVSGPGLAPPATGSPLLMLHLPDRSLAQFTRKIANGGASVNSNPALPQEISWHWRRDFDRLAGGSLEQECKSRQLTANDVTVGFSTGALVPEFRLQRRLESLRTRTVLPGVLDGLFD